MTRTHHKTKKLALIVYAARLSVIAAGFGIKNVGLVLANLVKNYKILIFLYLVLLIQVLLLISQPAHPPSLPKIAFESAFHQKINQDLDLGRLQTYELPAHPDVIEKEIMKYEQDLEWVGGHRDIFVNLGLLNLALKNGYDYQRYLDLARQKDPIWSGFISN